MISLLMISTQLFVIWYKRRIGFTALWHKFLHWKSINISNYFFTEEGNLSEAGRGYKKYFLFFFRKFDFSSYFCFYGYVRAKAFIGQWLRALAAFFVLFFLSGLSSFWLGRWDLSSICREEFQGAESSFVCRTVLQYHSFAACTCFGGQFLWIYVCQWSG